MPVTMGSNGLTFHRCREPNFAPADADRSRRNTETAALSRRQKQKYNAEGIRMSDLGCKIEGSNRSRLHIVSGFSHAGQCVATWKCGNVSVPHHRYTYCTKGCTKCTNCTRSRCLGRLHSGRNSKTCRPPALHTLCFCYNLNDLTGERRGITQSEDALKAGSLLRPPT